LMLQNDIPTDYIISTGKLHTVRDFLKETFQGLGLDYAAYVVVDKEFYRKPENITLCGDNKKISAELDWFPKLSFQDIVMEMVTSELSEYDI
jgi:GDPmannose 4,6-dehydratase